MIEFIQEDSIVADATPLIQTFVNPGLERSG